MSGMSAESRGSISLKPIENHFVEIIAARTVARVSGNFANYLRNVRFPQLFEERTGQTRNSIDAYRAKGNNPAYLVRAGVGIPGNMNYLINLYKGRGKSSTGSYFNYAKKRDLINEGWKQYDGESKMAMIYAQELQKAIKEAESELEK